MKKPILFLITILFFISCEKHDRDILNSTISKLNQIKQIEYNVNSETFNKELESKDSESFYVYFDFTSNDSILGAKYKGVSEDYEEIFNGVKLINKLVPEKTILTSIPKDLDRSGYIYRSYLELKKIIPNLLSNKNTKITRLKDTIINKEECYLFKFYNTTSFIDIAGKLTDYPQQEKQRGYYLLSINKQNYLPLFFCTFFPSNSGHQSFSFYNIIEKQKNEDIWNMDIPENFKKENYDTYYQNLEKIIKDQLYSIAPNFSLKTVNNEEITLSKTSQKLTLLEFWSPYCPYCIAIIPKINILNKKYNELKILGIDITNKTNNVLTKIIENESIKYTILSNGENVSKQYNVIGTPTFFLLNEKKEIIFTTTDFNEKELIKVIEEYLN